MPLGLFGGNSAKPQPLSSIDSGSRERSVKKDAIEKDARGTVLKLQNRTVTIEKKLAEGGFAIVYLVVDKQNRLFALKRQFMNDDLKQVEACKRECQIISSLKGHKNIVHYVDHSLTLSKTGIYDYMLLTAYYKTSVLGLMNDRLANGKGLSPPEVLNIFSDMCEAVARLHHSHTPVIHRDLKVENILVDERNRGLPPIYVLCDFGSATTKFLSTQTHSYSMIEEEIEKYTTLSYRSPEMIDLYGGKPIGVKSDIWALGVMLYKLCYFSLPFGESAMAIQNGAFSFPQQPEYPVEIRTIIKMLLDADVDRRPNIFQAAQLAFDAKNLPNPVKNIEKVSIPSLSDCVAAFREGRNPSTCKQKQSTENIIQTPTVQEVPLCSTDSPTLPMTHSLTTSVNPRLRPKPTNSIPRLPQVPPSPKVNTRSVANSNCVSEQDLQPTPITNATADEATENSGAPLSCPLIQPTDLGFTDLDDRSLRNISVPEVAALKNGTENVTQNPFDAVDAAPNPIVTSLPQTHRRNASDCSAVMKSAFKPYSQSAQSCAIVTSSSSNDVHESVTTGQQIETATSGVSTWNPFTAAPFGSDHNDLNDDRFGQCFDELPRQSITEANGSINTLTLPDELDGLSIDSRDPFGAAPFDVPSTEEKLRLRAERDRHDSVHSVGSAGDLQRVNEYDSSEVDEVRVASRRRFSYEHIDGVGDDASSDSRARTEDDSNTDDPLVDDEDECDHSQTTEGGIVSDEGGSRPLLDDDELDEDNDEELWVDVSVRRNTNPFLNNSHDGMNEKTPEPTVNPSASNNSKNGAWEMLFDAPETGWERRDTLVHFEKPHLPMVAGLEMHAAPATLPRQVTPLCAAPRPPPKPVNIPPPIDTTNMEANMHSVAPPVPLSAPVVSTTGSHTVAPAPMSSISNSNVTSSRHTSQYVPSVLTTPAQQYTNFSTNFETSESNKDDGTVFGGSTLSHTIEKSSPDAQIPKNNFSENEGFSAVHAIASSSLVSKLPKGALSTKKVPKGFGYSSPKVKKDKNKKVPKRRNSSSSDDPETDDSGAGMFASTSSKVEKDKKKKSFSLKSGNPIMPTDLKLTQAHVQKAASQQKRASSSKRGSSGAVNASFVNSSFQL